MPKNKMAPFSAANLCLLLLAGLLISCNQGPQDRKDPGSDLFAGAASAPVNPPTGPFTAGDRPNRRFTGVNDSIYVKAAVFSDGKTALALLTVDCIGLLHPTVQQIRNQAALLVRHIDLPASNIIVSSDHTHSGPDVVGIWGPEQTVSGVDSAYMAFLVSTAARQVLKASENLQPVSASYGITTHGEDWVHNICEPEEVDRSLTTLQFTDARGQSLVTLTNFACHPTFFDGVHDVVSADYVWGFYERMQQRLPGEHLFLQGAIGGWVQPDKGDRSFELGFRRGAGLAEATLRALETGKPLHPTAIRIRNRRIDMPVENPGWRQLAQMGVIDRAIDATTTTEMVWFAIGPAQFVTHPGETPPAYSFLSRELMDSEPTFVLGLAMDAMGYILKPEYFDDPELPHAAYLTSMSPGREAGPLVVETLKSLIPQGKEE